MVATYKGNAAKIGEIKDASICELFNMQAVPSGRPDVALFNAGDNDAMKWVHKQNFPISVSRLSEMHATKAVNGLGAFKSTKGVDNVCKACVDGKEMSAPHPRSKKNTNKVFEFAPVCAERSIHLV